MTAFTFERSCGDLTEREFATLAAAQAYVETIIEDVVWAEQADADGTNDDGEQCWRLLCWASEEDAENDNGAKSCGQLSWVGEVD